MPLYVTFAPYALKGQKLIAQGITLGNHERKPLALFAIIPRAMPWARSFWAFSPYLNHLRNLSEFTFLSKQMKSFTSFNKFIRFIESIDMTALG